MSFRKITINSGNEESTLEVTEEEYRNYFRSWWQQKKLLLGVLADVPSVVSYLNSESEDWQAVKEKSRNIPCSVRHCLIKCS